VNHNQDTNPTTTRPHGVLPDPHEWARSQEPPPFNRPDVPYCPPAPGYNSNSWVQCGPAPFTWCGAKPDEAEPEPVLLCQAYLLEYIRELKRRHAEEWLRKDDDLIAAEAVNQSLARQVLAQTDEPASKPQWPTPKRGAA
jgi:hypothetical protein